MPQAKSYPSGVPCWIDTEQPDAVAAERFYGGLFGWTFQDASSTAIGGSYRIGQLGGQDAAAIATGSGSTAVWNTYVAVDDADRVAGAVVRAGGQVRRNPQDVGEDGRTATVSDPTGAVFRLWQAGRLQGAQVVNAPGTWNFSDLHTTDPAAAAAFYGAVFGWEADDLDVGDGGASMWRRPGYGDHLAATVDPDIYERQKAAGAPPGFADAIAWLARLDDDDEPHWHVTFAVADRDTTMADALALGASDLSGPMDTMWTKATLLRDPQGAIFTVSQFTPRAS